MRQFTPTFRPQLETFEPRLVPAVLFVDDDGFHQGKVVPTSIQTAVDLAAPGDTIRVLPGTYREQVRVTTDNLKLESVNRRQAIIQPPAGGLSADGNGILLAVTDDADGVVVDGFTVRGPDATGNLYAGIAVGFGASARIVNNLVTDIRADPLSGAQTGLGIVVQEADAVVSGNTVQRYQKAGIVAFGPGNVIVRGNTVTGGGPTGVIAQIGIQVSDGATALVSDNTVSGNSYTGPAESGEAAGIAILGAGAVAVSGNKLDGNQIGIAAEGQTAGLLVADNRVRDSSSDGIRLTDAKNALVLGNRVSESGGNGIVLLGTTTQTIVAFNRVSGSGADDYLDDSTGSNLFFGNR